MEIAIIGAGIGGLACAAYLAKDDHRVRVFDQFATPRPVGSGLVIQPVGQDVLDEIGCGDNARTAGAPLRRMLGHEVGRGRRVLDVSYDRHGDQAFGLAIHRASLFDALHGAATAAGAQIVPDARVSGAGDGRLHLDNGAHQGPFDLVIDASGVNSRVSPLKARALPYGAIWGCVDWPTQTDLPNDELRQKYRRADRMIGVMPMGRVPGDTTPKAAVFWSLPRDGHANWLAGGLTRWKDEAIGLWPEFAPFLEGITDPNQMNMARYAHGTLRRPYRDRLTFIGDAAHRASPQLGQGANMALLDARALAMALRQAPVAQALPLYARARRWHVRIYQAMSAAFTPQYQSDSRILPFLRDNLLFPLSMIPPVPRILTGLVRGDLLPAKRLQPKAVICRGGSASAR